MQRFTRPDVLISYVIPTTARARGLTAISVSKRTSGSERSTGGVDCACTAATLNEIPRRSANHAARSLAVMLAPKHYRSDSARKVAQPQELSELVRLGE